MNQSVSQIDNASFGSKLIQVSETVNFYSCFFLIIIGLIGNITAIILLKSYSSSKNHLNTFYKSTIISTSQLYILALAFSDSIFLLSHFIEDILPAIDRQNTYLQFVNKWSLLCKFIIYTRNSARLFSSYIVVLFAFERFIVINFPLRRLKYQSKKFTQKLIVILFAICFIVTIYSFFINGLRKIEKHEKSLNTIISLKYEEWECDVLVEYKNVYNYFIISYTSFGIIIPIFFVLFFNLSIARILFIRKNSFLRNFSESSTRSSLLTNQKKQCSNGESEAFKLKESKVRSFCEQIQESPNEPIQKKPSFVEFYERSHLNVPRRFYSFRSSSFKQNLSFQKSSNSTFELDKQSRFKLMSKKFQESGRATLILILLSIFFVALNFPYILAWCNFYIPFERKLLKNDDDIYIRFSFVLLSEILHVSNFSINIFLYCVASKRFREQLKMKLWPFKK